MTIWAVKPVGREDAIRIERADDPIRAIELAFGRSHPRNSPLAKYDIGRWLAKNLGTRIAVVQSDTKRIALLRDPAGWFDPYQP